MKYLKKLESLDVDQNFLEIKDIISDLKDLRPDCTGMIYTRQNDIEIRINPNYDNSKIEDSKLDNISTRLEFMKEVLEVAKRLQKFSQKECRISNFYEREYLSIWILDRPTIV